MSWKFHERRPRTSLLILLLLSLVVVGCGDTTTSERDNINGGDGPAEHLSDSANADPSDGLLAGHDGTTDNDTKAVSDGVSPDILAPNDVAVFQPDDVLSEFPPGSPQETICCATPETETTCAMLMARSGFASPTPVALQFTLHWNPSDVVFLRFQDEFCTRDTCFVVEVPPSGLFPSGHSVGITPKDPSKWNGFFGVLINTIAHPAPPIVDAWLDESAQIHGNPIFLELVIGAQRSSSPAAACVLIKDLAASDANGFGLKAELKDGIVLVD